MSTLMKKPLIVGKLIEILEQYDPQSVVKIYDATFRELEHIDKVFNKVDDVIIQIKGD